MAVDLIRNHFLLHGAPIPEGVITEIVDDVYLPLLLAPRGALPNTDSGQASNGTTGDA